MATARVTCPGLSWPGLGGYIHLKSSLLETTDLRAINKVRSLKAPPPAVHTDLWILLHLNPDPFASHCCVDLDQSRRGPVTQRPPL